MKNCIIISIFLFLVNLAFAQEILTTSHPKHPALLTKFSFKQYNGGVMVIKGCLNNSTDSLNFILDTGSGGISLDSSTCVEKGIHNHITDTLITGMGGAHKANFAFKQQLHLPGLTVDNLDFHINDYDILTSVYGEKIDGIIGYSFLSRYVIKIDFDKNLIEVYSPGTMNYERGGYLMHPILANIPVEPINFKDRIKNNFNFYFDTGAGLCFLLNEKYVSDSSLLLKKRKPLITQAEGMAGKIKMRLTVIKQVQLGKYHFRNVPTYLYDDEVNVTAYPFVGGIIGNDLLRRFNLILNYGKHEIYLFPNTHFNDLFDYSYTGMAIYFENGKIIVDDIAPDSPAEKAGLKKDDIVFSVEKNFSNNIQQYKSILQSAKQKIKLIVLRNQELISITIKPKSFLR